jgi:hypothetical protein
MFANYIGRFRNSDEGSPSVSKSILENRVPRPSLLIDSLQMQNVQTSWESEFGVDIQDSFVPSNYITRVTLTNKTQEELETVVMDHTSPTAAKKNPNKRRESCPGPPRSPPPSTSSGIHPKPTTRSTVLNIESGTREVSQ